MATYKEVFQLAQDKRYKFYISYEWSEQLIRDKRETELFIELVLIQKWLRDEHKIHVFTSPRFDGENWKWNIQEQRHRGLTKPVTSSDKGFTYEQALLEGINEALKLIP